MHRLVGCMSQPGGIHGSFLCAEITSVFETEYLYGGVCKVCVHFRETEGLCMPPGVPPIMNELFSATTQQCPERKVNTTVIPQGNRSQFAFVLSESSLNFFSFT